MQTIKFRLPGDHVRLLLNGSGSRVTASVIANMLVVQASARIVEAIYVELTRYNRRDILNPPNSGALGDFGLELTINVPQMGWYPVPRYEDQG